MSIVTIASIALGVLILIGLLLGLLRSWKKSLIRLSLLIVSFVLALILSPKIAELLTSKYVDGLVISFFGQTIDLESMIGEIAGDLLYEGSALTTFATAILSIAIKLVAFLIIFVSMMIVTLIIYYVIVAIMAGRQRSRSVGTLKIKGWERLIGGGVGALGSLVICLALFTPIFGVMNVCDKFLTSGKDNAASAYNASQICGKFYTENKQIGQIESYLQKYDDLRKEYKSSFAGFMLTYTGLDALGKATFENLSTVTHNGMKVNFTDECVNIGNIYNIYKENFIESKFDLATEKSVEAIQKMYNISKNSEVMRAVIVDFVPSMSSKWANGETFIGMELPVTGDLKDIIIDMLGVFKTEEFSVLDKNINITIDAVKVANKYGVISAVNGGTELIDVIDNGDFVKDEINTLSASSDFRRVLPNILTTTVKLAYKSSIGEPDDKLDQEFTQEKLANVVWNTEADITQTIVSNVFRFIESEDVIDCLDDFGVVIDEARNSVILSNPVKVLMQDYINLKVSDLSEDSKTVILDAINENWETESYSFTTLFTTVQATAKVADNEGGLNFTDIPLSEMLKNDTDGKMKDTVQQAINAGIFKDLVGDNDKAEVYEDLISGVLTKENLNSENVQGDLEAGQVIADIMNKSDENNSMFGEDKNAEATKAIEDLVASNPVMDVLGAEAEKGESSTVKSYITTMNETDKEAFVNAIKDMEDSEDRNTLAKLFDVTFD